MAYLNAEVLARPNLTVAVNSNVDRIAVADVDGETRTTGIELSTAPSSPRYRVRANREVILSAGAFCTPKILLLSGIGPSADLEKLTIPLVKDLPVGRYLSEVSCAEHECHLSNEDVTFR